MGFVENIKKEKPKIHCLTNYVTINSVANILLAVGAKPIMADAIYEMQEITEITQGLMINIGTLHKDKLDAMFLAGKKANEQGNVIVLDPVGVGSSEFRTQAALGLLQEIKFDVIRGNISEIKTLAMGTKNQNGVDAGSLDKITDENIDENIEFVKKYALKMKTIVVVTGEIDLVTDGSICYVIKNGHSFMKLVSGTGCQLSALITASISCVQNNNIKAIAMIVCMMGIAGEIAFSKLEKHQGNASYAVYIMDAIYNMNSNLIEERALYEIR